MALQYGTASSGTFSTRPFVLRLEMTEDSVTYVSGGATNYSSMSWSLYMDPPGNYTTYNLDGSSSAYAVKIGTTTIASGTLVYDFRTDRYSSQLIASGTRNVSHIASGARTISYNATGSDSHTGAPLGTVTTTSRNMTLTLATPPTPAPGAPTYLSASSNNSNGIDLYWGGATGTIDSYDVWYSGSATGNPGANDVDFNTASTSLNLTSAQIGASQGDYRYFWVRAKNAGGASPWYPSGNGVQGQVAYTSRTANFYYNDGSGGFTSRTATSADNYIVTTPTPSRSGYNFSGWYNATSGGTLQVGAAAQYTIPSDGTNLYAQWTQAVVTPSWTTAGQTVNAIATLGLAYKNTSGGTQTVSATNGSTYTVYSGSLPNGLALASNGQLTGTPKAQGIFNFVIRATSITGHTADSGTIQIVSYPPGYRLTTDAGAKVQFTTAKRYVGPNLNTTNLDGQVVTADAYGYTPLTMMKRFIGVGQPGADVNGWINIVNKI